MRRASRIEAKPLEYVWRDRIAVGINLVAGKPGEGKSTLACQIAADVSHESPVILSNHEDPTAEVTVPRLIAAGADMRRVMLPEDPILFPADIPALRRRVDATGTRLVVCDSAAQHFGVSLFAAQQVRKALTPLKKMCEETGCAVLFIDHLRKKASKNASPLESLSGPGSGLPAAARFVYAFGRNPKEPTERVLAPVKVNATVMETSAAFEMDSMELLLTPKGYKKLYIEVGHLVMVDEASDCDASDVVSYSGKDADPGEGANVMKRAIAAEWLTGLLMHGAIARSTVEEEGKDAGFSWGTIRRAADLIPVMKKRVGGRDGKSMWSLPDGHPVLKVAAQMTGGDDE